MPSITNEDYAKREMLRQSDIQTVEALENVLRRPVARIVSYGIKQSVSGNHMDILLFDSNDDFSEPLYGFAFMYSEFPDVYEAALSLVRDLPVHPSCI